MERLLLLSTTTGYQAQSFAEAARRLGMEVVFGTDRCHVLEDPWHDAALALRFENPVRSTRMITEYAREHPLDAIVAVGDKPTVTAAMAAEALGLPWHPPGAAAACHVKFRTRELLRQAGLPTPGFTCFPLSAEPRQASSEVRFPCVLKPASLSGSRGVIRANNPGEFVAAFRRIAALLRSAEIQVRKEPATDQILAEDYIPGSEFAVEGLMHRGCLRVLAVFEKPDPLDGPYFEETIYVTPPRVPAAALSAIVECVERAVGALGLFHGPLHAEVRLNERGAWLLEMAARPIGGLCSRALRFTHGMPLEEVVVRNAAGEDLSSAAREPLAAGVMMIPVPRAGVFEGTEGEEEARAVPGIDEIRITAKAGQKLVPWPEGASYPGFIFARADSTNQVEQALREAHERLRFRIAPALSLV